MKERLNIACSKEIKETGILNGTVNAANATITSKQNRVETNSTRWRSTIRRSGMSNIDVRALSTMGIQKNYLRNIIKALYAMKVTS